VKFRDEVEDSAIDSLAVSIAILDVDNHRRFLSDAIDVTNLPPLLLEGVTLGEECIYIRVCLAENLEKYL
jgi:crossover junction endodeoxyribonuclease RusA